MTRKKRKKKESLVLKFVFIFLAMVFAGSLVFSNWKVAQKRKELNQRIQNLQIQINELANRKKELEQGIYESEKETYWEARVRDLGYKKPGEEMVVIKREPEAQKETPVQTGFWQNFIGGVRDIFE